MPKSIFSQVSPMTSLRSFIALRINLGIIGFGGVGIDADLVAKLSATQQGINGSVIDLASNVPQGHFDGGNSAPLPRVAAELLDLSENIIQLQGVLSHEPAF